MSLRIKDGSIMGVLLADGWHDVESDGVLFDAYEFMDGDTGDLLHGGGPGFSFTDADLQDEIAGPVASIIAVRYIQ